MILDKQYAFSVIIILLGFGIMQLGNGSDSFVIGAGAGTVAIGILWLIIRIVLEFKRNSK